MEEGLELPENRACCWDGVRRRGGDAVPVPSTVAFPESKDSVTTAFSVERKDAESA